MAGLATFDPQEIQRFAHEFETAFNREDYQAMASFYADDGTLIGDGTETQHGRSAIERFWQATCKHAAALQMKRTIQVQKLEVSGDLGYVTGTVHLEIPSAEAQATAITVRYVTVWRRQPGEAWQLVMDISNRSPST
jgi:uncharacterized protein (TIGR02246 family)